jgi:hypothetical protein
MRAIQLLRVLRRVRSVLAVRLQQHPLVVQEKEKLNDWIS